MYDLRSYLISEGIEPDHYFFEVAEAAKRERMELKAQRKAAKKAVCCAAEKAVCCEA